MTVEKVEGSSDVEMIESHAGLDSAKDIASDAYGIHSLRTGHKTKAERTLLLKADMCIVPLAALCYLVSYLVTRLFVSEAPIILTWNTGSERHWKCAPDGLAEKH